MKFISKITLSFAIGLPLLFANCASIVSKGSWPVSVQSQPAGVDFIIVRADGTTVTSGKTPQIVTLDSGSGYFRTGSYVIKTLRKGKVVGEQELTASINGWYWGNLVFGGLIGFIIVDPLTGAMYKLPKDVTISGGSTAALEKKGSLTIASIETLTPEQRQQLVRL